MPILSADYVFAISRCDAILSADYFLRFLDVMPSENRSDLVLQRRHGETQLYRVTTTISHA